MIKVKALKPFKNPDNNEEIKKDQVINVTNNTAHYLFENKLVEIVAQDKMMAPTNDFKKSKYITK